MNFKFKEVDSKTPLPDGHVLFKCDHRNITMLRTYRDGLMNISVAHPKRFLSWDEIKWIRNNVMKKCQFVAVILPT